MIIIESHKKKIETIRKQYPDALIHDVTSHATDEFVKFSPFYPIGGIPVPYSNGMTSACVEAIWQGLKVYEGVGCDTSLFSNTTMKNLKRTTRRFGQCKGHKKGVGGKDLLGYLTARKLIYLPSYKWVLENRLQSLVEKLREESKDHTVILLDYETNGNVMDASKPLSHASLIKAYIEGNYPEFEDLSGDKPFAQSSTFNIGDEVIHPKFGNGMVLSIEGDFIQIQFQEGIKKLSVSVAKLSPLK